MARSHSIADWNPEDTMAGEPLEAGNNAVAQRNLLWVIAFGALGGVEINLALRQSYLSTGTETPVFRVFLVVYVVAAVPTWMIYVRRPNRFAGLSGHRTESTPTRV